MKDAPSALNTVIIPNVTLPKVCNHTLTSDMPFRIDWEESGMWEEELTKDAKFLK